MTIAITVYKLIIEQRILLVILLGECSLVQNFTGVLIFKATWIFRTTYELTLKKKKKKNALFLDIPKGPTAMGRHCNMGNGY